MVFKISFANVTGTRLHGDFVAVNPVVTVIMDIHNTDTTSKHHHSTHPSWLGNRVIVRRPCLVSFLVEVKCAEFCLHYSNDVIILAVKAFQVSLHEVHCQRHRH